MYIKMPNTKLKTKLGAALQHQNGGGFNIQPTAISLNGKLVVLPVRESGQDE